MSGNYRLAPIFLIRLAGAPFESVKNLETCESSNLARHLLSAQPILAEAKAATERILAEENNGFSLKTQKAARLALRNQRTEDTEAFRIPELSRYAHVLSSNHTKQGTLDLFLGNELIAAREKLWGTCGRLLPSYLVFSTHAGGERIEKILAESVQRNFTLLRNRRTRENEWTLLLYLQRIAAKNDTLGEFGGTAWGWVQPVSLNASLDVDCTMRRCVYLERWTAHVAAAALNSDPAVRMELSPRLNPLGRIEDESFIASDTGEVFPLSSETIGILAECDGSRPAHSLGCGASILEKLAESNFIRWLVEVPALELDAFQLILDGVSSWRKGDVRKKWASRLGSVTILAEQFSKTSRTEERAKIMSKAIYLMRELGASDQPQRFLYSAGNPIGEDCSYDSTLTISEDMVNQMLINASPWIDFWRDSYAFISSRVAAGLRSLLETGDNEGGVAPLPSFIKQCAERKLPVTSHGIVGLAHIAFQELKAAFRQNFAHREDASEWNLSSEDCHFVRRTLEYPKFDEYTYPSADLQISATSLDAVRRDEYQWVLAELHPALALLQHCMYWSCPDKAMLSRELARTTCGKPNFYYGFFAADFTSHTTVRQMEALRDLSYYVAEAPGNPDWQIIPPSETEVFISEENGDVGLRRRGSHEYLGSFARYWIIPLGFHPFFFGRAPHMPRLRCGKVIVQRESWTITRDELGAGDFTGISRDLVLAVERLRAARNLPRYIYIRPTEQALRRSGAEGRDKDTKPVFIDLESYLFLEIFLRWLTKAGEIEVTEMLPDPDHLFWREEDGRHTFELRTLIVPRE